MRGGIEYRAVGSLTIRKDFVFKLLGTPEYGFTLLDGEDGIMFFEGLTHTYQLLNFSPKSRPHAFTLSLGLRK